MNFEKLKFLSSYYLNDKFFSLCVYRKCYYILLLQPNNNKLFRLLTCSNLKSIVNVKYNSYNKTYYIYLFVQDKYNSDFLMSIKLNNSNTNNLKINNCTYSYKPNTDFLNYNNNYKKSKANIIESIAMQEVGLSTLLNSEGEKLQKSISLAQSTEELIAINKSVDKVLTNITVLENLLYSKLRAILEN